MIYLTFKKEDIDKIRKLLGNLDPKKKDGAIRRALVSGAGIVLKKLVSNVSGGILHRRTGNLARSMGYRIEEEEGNLVAIIGSGASLKADRMIYANIHETGKTIKPINAQMLAIPIGQALTPAGVARYKPRDIDGFIARSKAGNLILFKKGNPPIPMFVLKDNL
jgi:hypothetical protein